MADLTNIEFWEKLINNATESYKKWFEEERKFLRENVSKNAKVLEVGCGDGRSFADIIDITQNLFGVDHDKKAVDDAKIKFKEYPKLKFELAEADKLPYKNNLFDVVTIMGTFANFADKKYLVLEEIKRVLKKDGIIIISVFSEDAFEERMKVYKKFKAPIKEIKGNTVIFDNSLGDNISEQFSKKQLLDIFDKAKLKIIDIQKKNIAYLCKLKK